MALSPRLPNSRVPTRMEEMTMSRRIVMAAFVALATAATAPALAREPLTPDLSTGACGPDVHRALRARGRDVKGLDHQGNGFVQLSTAIVIACPGDHQTAT